ncbi:lactate racemase domain-containing protein [uncultured Clostridium sp.]|uniref:lactate racemase domain-containing protein n=1 Tax=uncultured Clostridium sp. TaxID=59620 RepID=UPI0025DDD3A8|nr:lactate racemase domain-containing protein [uncultured Clostridium sp.]
MPLLLEEDYNIQLPAMHRVRQKFERPQVQDLQGRIREEMAKERVAGKIKKGQRVAVAVGSRGIRNLAAIVRGVVDEIKKYGGDPFIVSAMGSHGGGTEEGQKEILTGYGITEEAMGVPVIARLDVVEIGTLKSGTKVFFDKTAYEADLVVPINRVKIHTDFVADIQSGLCKMLVIGLGNHIGCTSIHEESFDYFGEVLKEAASMIMQSVNVGFGVAILENAYDETAWIEAVPSENMIEREKQLVKMAAGNMPTLMIPEIDVLIVEKIGKDISGCGYDPNILGKSYLLKEFILTVPKIDKMVLLDLSEETHGNGVGLGIFDITTKKVFEQLDYESIYANGIAVKDLDDCKIPVIAKDEDEAVKIAVKVLRGADKKRLKIVRIESTLRLEYIEVSDALLPLVEADERLELV